MAREFSRWFRFYDSVLDDPKVQRLTDPLFRAWVNLMCLANRHGGLIPADYAQLAFSLRCNEAKAKTLVAGLAAAGLMETGATFLTPHNWSERQFKSDVSTERVKRFRERSMQRPGNGPGNGVRLLPETAPDTEQSRAESEQRFCSSSQVNSPIKPLVQNQDSVREESSNQASPSSASGLDDQSSEGSAEVKATVHPLLKTLRKGAAE